MDGWGALPPKIGGVTLQTAELNEMVFPMRNFCREFTPLPPPARAGGGGGGWGDPLERDQAQVREDVLDEYVSLEGARRDYGVVIDPETLEVDLVATGCLQEEMRKERL